MVRWKIYFEPSLGFYSLLYKDHRERWATTRRRPSESSFLGNQHFFALVLLYTYCTSFPHFSSFLIVYPSDARCAKNCGWGGFSTFQRWRSRVFFESNLTDPSQIFDAYLLENTDLSTSSFHFSVGFISRPLITSFYMKRYLFFLPN